MKNDHHRFPHAFAVTLWVFLNLQGNALELGLDLNNVIFPIPKKSTKLLRLAFSFAPDYSEPKKIQY